MLSAFVVGFLIVGTGRFHLYHMQETSAAGTGSAISGHKLRALVNSRSSAPVSAERKQQTIAAEVEAAKAAALASLPKCHGVAETKSQCPACPDPVAQAPAAAAAPPTTASGSCPVIPAAETLGGLIAYSAKQNPKQLTDAKAPPAPRGAQQADGPTIQLLSYIGPFGA